MIKYLLPFLFSLSAFGSISHCTRYVEVTINATYVDEAIEWGIVYFSPGDTTFWTYATADNIRFTNSTGSSELAFFILSFNDAGTTGTGAAFFNTSWISASVNSKFRIYFGGTATAYNPSDTYGRNNVFDSNTVTFWALTGSSSLTDLTGSGYDLTAVASPTSGASGPVQGVDAYEFNGSTQYLYRGSSPLTSWPLTLEAWFNSYTSTAFQAITSVSRSTDNQPQAYISSDGATAGDPVRMIVRGDTTGASSAANTSTGYNIDTWHLATGTRDLNSGTSKAYIDSGSLGTNAIAVTSPTWDRATIGGIYHTSFVLPFNGSISLVSMHDVVKTQNWITTRYNNYTNASFFSWGSSQLVPVTGNTWYLRRR